ncbi:hypothetical protein JXA56_02910 [Candidatus Micrarchaeota archaeon]|nr:hypothetical protein [Candidatus Micrarchaeota archaeon]
MSDDCKGCEDCNCQPKEIDLKELGPEAEELASKFEELNGHILQSLETRHKILEYLHTKAGESQEMKEKLDKVIQSRHPVLLQFVFGLQD